ncbi:FeoB-associated Cys-rich membrane protein [Solidesulfovibrio sp.]|uniref:FeoB-associated Cys-rich membrane protein n=1 Tax=Solidesulfovibrio sp. TaxID=2910990 RepID=UPI002634380A|nr:FeoB-associated Cys-rich membrane protein [Solidesulfovibrio sp.]
MDKLIVFLIIALAAGYVIRRFFFKKGTTGCGCGCGSGGCDTPERKGACCGEGQKPL